MSKEKRSQTAEHKRNIGAAQRRKWEERKAEWSANNDLLRAAGAKLQTYREWERLLPASGRQDAIEAKRRRKELGLPRIRKPASEETKAKLRRIAKERNLSQHLPRRKPLPEKERAWRQAERELARMQARRVVKRVLLGHHGPALQAEIQGVMRETGYTSKSRQLTAAVRYMKQAGYEDLLKQY